MNKFPVSLNPKKSKDFAALYLKHCTNHLRLAVYQYIISESKDGLDLTQFKKDNHMLICTEDVLKKIRDELHKLGWLTCLEYGSTVFFVYKEEKDKPNVHGVNLE